MKAYRDRYGELETKSATLLAISTDKEATQAEFKASVGATYPFIADSEGILCKLYGVKAPILNIAKRVTFVVGSDGRVLSITDGGEAIDPSTAIGACALRSV